MRQGSERVLLVTNQNPQTTIFVDFITEQITRIVSVTAPRDYLDTPSGETTVVLLDADHLGEDIMQEWHKKLADTPSCHLTAFNLRDEDHAASLLTFLHLRGVFYRDDHLLQICKGIDSLFSGNLWMSRSLMTRMIEFFRKQQLNAYRPSCGLTQREIEILSMVSSGASNCEIANQLFLSEYTVKSHLYNVFKKIDVHNRTQAANWARQNIGVLPPSAAIKRK